jgi:glycosyltransferase involved in cell wall biosynthesis
VSKPLGETRIAIVHDWLVTYAGAEKVLEQMLHVLPQADLFSIVDFLGAKERGFLRGKTVITSFVQRMPGAKSHYRRYLPLMPLAVEQFDLSMYDIVISSSYAVAKGVITGPDQLHVCMCYSPIRYAWDLQHQYLREAGLDRGLKGWVTRALLHYIRGWDARTSNGVDAFIAISEFIRRRIHKVYRRESTVIYPPVDTSAFELSEHKDDFYLTASRLVPYKKVDLIVQAFGAMPDKRLVVIGGGPDFDKVRGNAGPNIEILGHQPFEVLRDHMQRATAFVFAAEEDFGIAPVEAQACGTPVIAYGKGGALETVLGLESDKPTGVFFESQTGEALAAAIARFEQEATRFSPASIRENSLRFSVDRFRNEFSGFVDSHWETFQRQPCRVDAP